MEHTDLSFIPIGELIDEVEKRCDGFVCAYMHYEDKRENMNFRYGKGSWYVAIQLSTVLGNDVLNNWNGEMRLLQRINEEGDNE